VNVLGVDDAPFARDHRGDVLVVATAFAGLRLDGVLSTKVRRDGANATRALAAMIGGSRFAAHTAAVLLQGIALAGFNVVDVRALHEALGIPVIVVARRAPDLEAMRAALDHVPGGARMWALIEKAGPMEELGPVHVQRAGVSLERAAAILEAATTHGHLPEPLRAAHLIAGGVTTGESRGRA
jgi:hypothetical protein